MSTAENILAHKSAQSAAPQDDAPQPQPTQPQSVQSAAPSQDDDASQTVSDVPDENAVSGNVNLQRGFSRLNEALVKCADGLGVQRRMTLPHTDGQTSAEHIANVSQILNTSGGLTANLILAGHSQYGSAETIAYPAQKLRETIIPQNDPNAKQAISACSSLVSKVESLIGETPEIKLAKSQLKIVGKYGGTGMNAADFIIALIQIPAPVIQAVARAHSGTKNGGHAPHLRAPRLH